MIYGLQDVVRLSRMVAESPSDEFHKRVERAKLDALLGWCEITTCRRHELLRYFGEASATACGNCDICLRPPATWDGTEAGRKALSCVYRTGQRFGAGHVIDVLRGQNRDKVLGFGHDRLSTFGIGTEFSDRQWRSILRQLVVRGYLSVDHARYGALRLTEESRALLRGEETLRLREDPEPTRARRAARISGGRKPIELNIEDEELMDALRALRKEIADEQGVPPYVVFHDATLIEMIQVRPASPADLLEISGIGQSKLEKYGQKFLDLLGEFDGGVRRSTI
ncbi:MAG: HRDC domain-containing protein, partial [Pseudomonadales bacterium]|nr:HRDC domain-containing protein [Pseudomonadales bacterium]